jgi:hypothetical protein
MGSTQSGDEDLGLFARHVAGGVKVFALYLQKVSLARENQTEVGFT